MDWLDLLQWPAFAVTVVAGWLVAADDRHKRLWGFGLFLVSNALWVAWGWSAAAWALVALQVFLLVTNVRGVADNREADGAANREGGESTADP
ncbi:hypothetical protein RQM47_03045 [Rubrivirga sp. S365]|uniref:Amino acid transporter n=1 Tax=Rubrivirga litoralis TaxID=3075598 RepID=A0ABU3BQT2_9BACT|nr:MULTISPECIES: hypothetical protein [unclassified Rubrivirga]MDT0631649.1 hypothetical protein [Rubrivirga sp. F394]MDT7855608.1 hypothetical protein [Rubrivirga sp. S365]